jgi:signal transduction histidine kinase
MPTDLRDDVFLRQRLLVANLWVIMATIVVSCVLIAPLSDDASGEILLGLLPYGIANSVALWLAYRGRVLLSLVQFSFVLFSMHAASLFLLAQLPPHFFLGMVNFIILNGVVLGGRAALVTTAVTLLCGLGFPKLGKINSDWTESIANDYGLQIILSEETLGLSIFTTTCSTGFLLATTLRLQAATRSRLRDALGDLHTAQEHLELRRVRAEELAALGSRLAVATKRDDVLQAVESSLAAVMSGEVVQWAEVAPTPEQTGIRFGSGPDARWLVLRRDAPSNGLAFMKTVAELQESAFSRINSVERVSMASRLEGVARLSASVAHDFKNLLVPIAGAHEIIGMDSNLSLRSMDMLERSRSATSQATALIDKLLTHSRAHEVEESVFDARSRLAEMEPLLRTFLSGEFDLEYRIDDGAVKVCMDPVEFDQVVLNLVLNARDAMVNGGQIRILLGMDQDEDAGVVLAVEDEGPGIPCELRGWILEPFHTTRDEGTGLGLATVSRIVRHGRGTVTVGDSDLGGASFRIWLPGVIDREEERARMISLASGADVKGRRVLLVDDDRVVAETTADLLRTRGHEVIVRYSMQSAIEALQISSGVAIILSDFRMASGSGMKLLEHLRTVGNSVPFVILSGYGAAIPSSALHQPDAIISKPAGAAELTRVIEEFAVVQDPE